MFPGLKIHLTKKVELQAIDPESQINDPTDQQVANLSFEHPDQMVKSSIFKSLYEDKKKTLEHVYNETLQGRKVDGKDPLTLKSLMLFLKMAVDILGLDTNLLNKSSSGCRLFQKLIYNYILTTIAQNILSTMDAAFDGIKSSKKFKQDPFCLLAYLESHGTKDPWKIFRSKKSAMYTYINRMRPRDMPFANWIRDAEKLMIELGQVPLPERKPDGTQATPADFDLQILRLGRQRCLQSSWTETSPTEHCPGRLFAQYLQSTSHPHSRIRGERGTRKGISWFPKKSGNACNSSSRGNSLSISSINRCSSSRVGTGDGEEEGVEDTEVVEEGMNGAAAGTEEEGTGASVVMPASTPLPLPTVEEETQGIANRGVANPNSRVRTSGPRTTEKGSGLLTLPVRPGRASLAVSGKLGGSSLDIQSLTDTVTGEEVIVPREVIFGELKERRRETASVKEKRRSHEEFKGRRFEESEMVLFRHLLRHYGKVEEEWKPSEVMKVISPTLFRIRPIREREGGYKSYEVDLFVMANGIQPNRMPEEL
uniref:Uncharacterized protein n=1 Tax=Chromera velia CCMP2878 TaxID=1169474 RepID=A0A0G4GUP2_9ALVE|eukprot:Cvel_5244.t1-p1 / transcript=Cvel_5244.t1 / gene=Cvel_5244 / organism=Chromera_velia_CCMP2878 / gene_product=hypothetical protein / transcript_product=hypothetical protein / location=Cvel_scaffold241:94233-99070(-) / protein_length=537 / sequence_SO=supercontig / SO=protein_coding / is_pseudo=false